MYKNGLKFHGVHDVNHSSRVQELEKQNSVHPRHEKQRFFKGKKHYIFSFIPPYRPKPAQQKFAPPTNKLELSNAEDQGKSCTSKQKKSLESYMGFLNGGPRINN